MIASLIPLDSERILTLIEQGHSRRSLARRFGVSPRTIEIRLRQALHDSLAERNREEESTSQSPPGFDPANLRRCRTCGSLVYLWPCLACQLEHADSSAPSPQPHC